MIRAVTVKQPWAGAIAALGKDVENRSWSTDYRGRLAIHAGKSLDPDGLEFIADLTGQMVPAPGGGPAWAAGAVVALVELVEVHRCDGSCSPWAIPDEFHWRLADVRSLAQPVPCRGALKLWALPDLVAAVLSGPDSSGPDATMKPAHPKGTVLHD